MTRGFGPVRRTSDLVPVPGRSGPVTLGYGGGLTLFPPPRKFIRGRSSDRNVLRQVEEILIFAKLASVNGKRPPFVVEDRVRVLFDRTRELFVRGDQRTFSVRKPRLKSLNVVAIKKRRE